MSVRASIASFIEKHLLRYLSEEPQMSTLESLAIEYLK